MKILFVENHAIFARQVTACFLSAHEVTIVSTLADARRRLNVDTFDVVLVDYDLDDGKGEQLIREMRGAGRTVRIIGVSAREDGNAALLRAGADATCSKMNFDRIQEMF